MNTKKCTFSGAHLNLMVVTDGKLEVVEGDKLSVGHKLPETFKSKSVPLSTNSVIYLSTDGFRDQKSVVRRAHDDGQRSKKIGRLGFEKMLCELSAVPMKDQGEKLKGKFEEWKGDGEQIDDVLVIGLRI